LVRPQAQVLSCHEASANSVRANVREVCVVVGRDSELRSRWRSASAGRPISRPASPTERPQCAVRGQVITDSKQPDRKPTVVWGSSMSRGDRPPGITARTGYSVQSATMCRPPLTASSTHRYARLSCPSITVRTPALPHYWLLHGFVLHGCCTQHRPPRVKSQVKATKSCFSSMPGQSESAQPPDQPQRAESLLNGLFLLTAVDRRTPLFAGAYCTDIARP
jgi:hypothetical protein